MTFETVIDQPVIAAERFDLRPLRGSDAGLIAHNAGDARVARATANIPHPYPPGAAEALIARAQAEGRAEDIWAIDGTRTRGSEVMGLVSLTRVDEGQSEISYWVAPAYWNAGIASAAVEATLAAYQVSRVDLLMLLDSQMTLFSYEISRTKELVNFNKALAEIELLTGKQMF